MLFWSAREYAGELLVRSDWEAGGEGGGMGVALRGGLERKKLRSRGDPLFVGLSP
jgi:hypothetical protein